MPGSTINFTLRADTAQGVAAIEKMRVSMAGLDKDTNKTAETTETAGQKITGMFAKMGVAVGAAVIAKEIFAIGKSCVTMAVNAVESENLFSVSMGNMADAAMKWSKDTSKALNLNEYELRKNVGTFNVMLNSMGMTEKQSYDMAKSMTILANDMASFYNLDPTEAFDKLRAGISGEAEGLKRLGILVNDTMIQEYAYRNGIAKTGEALTDQQKVLARYGTIMEQTSKAQGDLARTMDSPANSMRALQAQTEMLGTELGKALLPILSSVVRTLFDFVKGVDAAKVIQTLKDAVVPVTLAVTALGAALIAIKWQAISAAAASMFGVLANAGAAASILASVRSMNDMRVASDLLSGSMSTLGKMGLAAGAIFVGWKLGTWLEQNITLVHKFGDAVAGVVVDMMEWIGLAPSTGASMQSLEDATFTMQEKLHGMGVEIWRQANETVPAWNARVLEALKSHTKLIPVVEETTKTVKALTPQQQELIDKYDKTRAPLSAIVKEYNNLAAAGADVSGFVRQHSEEILKAGDNQLQFAGKLDKGSLALFSQAQVFHNAMGGMATDIEALNKQQTAAFAAGDMDLAGKIGKRIEEMVKERDAKIKELLGPLGFYSFLDPANANAIIENAAKDIHWENLVRLTGSDEGAMEAAIGEATSGWASDLQHQIQQEFGSSAFNIPIGAGTVFEKPVFDPGTYMKDLTEFNAEIQRSSTASDERRLSSTQKMSKEISTIFDDWGKGIADAIIKWDGFWGTVKEIATESARGLLRILLEGVLSPLQNILTKVATGIGSWISGLFTGGNGLGLGKLITGGGGIASLLGGTANAATGGGTAITGGLLGLLGLGSAVLPGTATALTFGGVGLSAGALSGAGAELAASMGLAAPASGGLGGMMGAIGGFMTNPVTIAIAGGLAAGLLGYKFAKGKNAWDAGAPEAMRDFGVNINKGDWQTWAEGMGLTEKSTYPIRKELESSPAFLAANANQVDVNKLKAVSYWGGTVDMSEAFNVGKTTGDWTALNEIWLETLGTSSALAQNMPDFKEKLLGVEKEVKDVGEAANETADSVANLADRTYTLTQAQREQLVVLQKQVDAYNLTIEGLQGMKDQLEPATSMYEKFMEDGTISEEFSKQIADFGGNLSNFKEYARLAPLKDEFQGLVDEFRDTGEVVPRLRELFTEFGGDLSALDNIAKLPGIEKTITSLEEFRDSVTAAATPVKTMYQLFVETGKLTPELSAQIKDLGGSLANFQDYATAMAAVEAIDKQIKSVTGLRDAMASVLPLADSMYQKFAKTGEITPELRAELEGLNVDMAAFQKIAQMIADISGVEAKIQAITGLRDAFAQTGDVTQDMIDAFVEFGVTTVNLDKYSGLKGMGSSFAELVKHFKETGEILPGLRTAFKDFGGDLRFLDAAAALPNLTATLGTMKDLYSGIEDLIPRDESPLAQFLKNGTMTGEMQSTLQGALTKEQYGQVQLLGNALQDRARAQTQIAAYKDHGDASGLMTMMRQMLPSMSKDMDSNVSALESVLNRNVSGLAASVLPFMKQSMGTLSGIIGSTESGLDSQFGIVADNIETAFGQARGAVINDINSIIDKLGVKKDGLTAAFQLASSDLISSLDTVIEKLGTQKGGLTDAFDQAAIAVVADINKMLGPLRDEKGDINTAIETQFTAVGKNIASAFEAARVSVVADIQFMIDKVVQLRDVADRTIQIISTGGRGSGSAGSTSTRPDTGMTPGTTAVGESRPVVINHYGDNYGVDDFNDMVNNAIVDSKTRGAGSRTTRP